MKRFILKTVYVLLLVVILFVILGLFLPYNKYGYMRACVTKEKTIENSERGPMILLVGGSSVAFGYDCKMMSDSLGRKVYNTGLHAGLGSKCIIDEISQNAKSGDIIILALEEFSYTKNKIRNGESIITDAAILHPGILRRFCIGQWMTFIGGLPQYIKAKTFYVLSGMEEIPVEKVDGYDCRGFNDFGDYTIHYDKGCHNTKITEKSSTKAEIDWGFIEYIKNKIHLMESRGAIVYVIPTTLNQSSYNNTKDNIDDIAFALKKSGIPYICEQDLFVLPDSLYYDSQRHLGKVGTLIRTERTIEVLKPLIERNVYPSKDSL